MMFWSLPVALLPALASAFHHGKPQNNTFDYVVVGGGTAGIPIGTRLAEAGYTVAIVEAGGWYEDSEPIISSTPAFGFANNAANDWGFVVEPQPGMGGRAFGYPRGKCMGGSSARNLLIAKKDIRAPVGSFQMWADKVNDQSYSWSKFERCFKKGTSFTAPDPDRRALNATPGYQSDAFSSGSGPLSVTYANWASPISSWIQRAMEAVGIDDAGDFNSGEIIGSQYFALTTIPGTQERASAENTYLKKFQDLPNLTVYTETLAKRILFDDSKTATGVVVEIAGVEHTLAVDKEVILSAGVFQSPQLLMVSGVGPADSLNSFSIPIVHDSPYVGQNLVDHVWFGAAYRVGVPTWTEWVNDGLKMLQLYVDEYRQRQQGPLTANAGDFGAFEKVPNHLRAAFTPEALQDLAQFPDDWPEVEYIVSPMYLGNFNDPMGCQPKDGHQYASVNAALVAPVSLGNVTIQSADTNDAPIINTNTLGSRTDQQVAIAAFKRLREIFEASELAPVRLGDEYYPGKQSVRTDAEILRFIQQDGLAFYHAGSSCAMGDPTAANSTAVVDSKARVIGVNGVRVVDAAALPFLPPSHIQSAICVSDALSEKIAEEIINEGSDGPTRFEL
ncbi:GMC family oxidoreductase [Aspergillus clavatus NRRL 1]|uniref:Versicolorin B synthase, putative n=1 Tax=Aspergillus clavatus (strain ATCC 1007 / CBS 513.65 / DSM 816 / NCTC 3887 / NRRL 1 / QM 1276 / 107) TaxID=344612 RepID=A1CLQ8_ASPCL|nr:versicolorin B synthase, putative [Aspergillus clavatus NRRL 1]EAW09037.1 versicolorin B synthase, putative [Aspergillus clavatus NRRL 1]